MDLGKLDRFITIEQSTSTKAASGAVTHSWSTLVQVWADRREATGRERILNGVEENQKSTTFYIRYDSRITNRMRVVDGSDVFDIEHVREVGRQAGLELICNRKTG